MRPDVGAGGETVCGLSKRGWPGRRIATCARQPAGSCQAQAATAVPSGATESVGWAAECVLSEIVRVALRVPSAATKIARMRCSGLCLRTVRTIALPSLSRLPTQTFSKGSAAVIGTGVPRRLESEAVGVSQPVTTLPSKAACASGLASSAEERVVGDVHAYAGEAASAATSVVAARAGSNLDIVFQPGTPR